MRAAVSFEVMLNEHHQRKSTICWGSPGTQIHMFSFFEIGFLGSDLFASIIKADRGFEVDMKALFTKSSSGLDDTR